MSAEICGAVVFSWCEWGTCATTQMTFGTGMCFGLVIVDLLAFANVLALEIYDKSVSSRL